MSQPTITLGRRLLYGSGVEEAGASGLVGTSDAPVAGGGPHSLAPPQPGQSCPPAPPQPGHTALGGSAQPSADVSLHPSQPLQPSAQVHGFPSAPLQPPHAQPVPLQPAFAVGSASVGWLPFGSGATVVPDDGVARSCSVPLLPLSGFSALQLTTNDTSASASAITAQPAIFLLRMLPPPGKQAESTRARAARGLPERVPHGVYQSACRTGDTAHGRLTGHTGAPQHGCVLSAIASLALAVTLTQPPPANRTRVPTRIGMAEAVNYADQANSPDHGSAWCIGFDRSTASALCILTTAGEGETVTVAFPGREGPVIDVVDTTDIPGSIDFAALATVNRRLRDARYEALRSLPAAGNHFWWIGSATVGVEGNALVLRGRSKRIVLEPRIQTNRWRPRAARAYDAPPGHIVVAYEFGPPPDEELFQTLPPGAGVYAIPRWARGGSPTCKGSYLCTVEGACTLEKGRCVARSSRDCRRAGACRTAGRCTLDNGQCAAGPKSACRASRGCRADGLCSLDADREECVNKNSSDCARSTGCRTEGRCSAEHGECLPAIDLDCKRSRACRKERRCRIGEQGGCVTERRKQCEERRDPEGEETCEEEVDATSARRRRGPCRRAKACANRGLCARVKGVCRATRKKHCARSKSCRLEGACALHKGACAPRSAADCKRSTACRKHGRCVLRDGACRLPCAQTIQCREFGDCQALEGSCRPRTRADCEQAAICRSQGRCTPVAGSCVATSDADCRKSRFCSIWGACLAATDGDSEGECVSGSEARVRASLACSELGWCKPSGGLCPNGGSAADLKRSRLCTALGRCSEEAAETTIRCGQ